MARKRNVVQENQYAKEGYYLYKKLRICVTCRRKYAYKNSAQCYECREKRTAKQREKHNKLKVNSEYVEHRNKIARVRRKMLISNGLCTQCGKRNSREGKKSCHACSIKWHEYYIRGKT